MNHKVNTIHNHGWLIQEQPTPKQWVRLLRKYLSLLDWPIDGRFPIIYYSENGWNKNWAFYSCIQYLLYIYYICHRKFRWKIVAFIATWLYSIPRIHNPIWPRRRRPDRRWGMDPLNPWDWREHLRQTHGFSQHPVDFFGDMFLKKAIEWEIEMVESMNTRGYCSLAKCGFTLEWWRGFQTSWTVL